MHRFLVLFLALPLLLHAPDFLQPPAPVTPAYTCPGDSGQVVYTTGAVNLMDVVTGRIKILVSGSESDLFDGVSWSPDGTHLAFESNMGGDWGIYAVEVDKLGNAASSPYPLFDFPDTVEGRPDWSPDGEHLAFTVAGDEIYIGNVIDETTLNLGSGYTYDWIPDGSALIYTKSIDNAPDSDHRALYRANPATGEQTEIIPLDFQARVQGVSAGGVALLHGYDSKKVIHIMLVDVASGEIMSVNMRETEGWGWWSPDGTKIAYMTSGENNDIVLIDPVSGESEILTDELSASLAGSIYWSPDGTRIAFTAYGSDYPMSNVVHVMDVATHKIQTFQHAALSDMPAIWRPCAAP
ncbi:MAG TPA: hypothetical protein VHL11_02270 [Phototrophicaceae bacterium]|nr:hypothetical protein [Phototrophicaceae bacterium]